MVSISGFYKGGEGGQERFKSFDAQDGVVCQLCDLKIGCAERRRQNRNLLL